jgi:putative redox protein
MKAIIKWVDGVQFLGESGSGHPVVMDGPLEDGGRNQGIRPMEMLLLGMGGCTAFDVVTILKKARLSITGCSLEINAERAATPPKIFTHIHIHYILTGKVLSQDQVKRAIELSAEKYCSASVMLGKTAQVTHDFELKEVE